MKDFLNSVKPKIFTDNMGHVLGKGGNCKSFIISPHEEFEKFFGHNGGKTPKTLQWHDKVSALYVFLRKYRRITSPLLHLFYPTRCPVCGDFINYDMKFCGECESKLKYFSGDVYIPNAEGFSAVYEYNENISPAVFLLKNGICGNAAYALGNSLAEKLISQGISADMIIPVPMHPKDRRKRSLDQSFLIAVEIGAVMNIPVVSDLVAKIRRTSEQKHLSGKERRVNLIGAFGLK